MMKESIGSRDRNNTGAAIFSPILFVIITIRYAGRSRTIINRRGNIMAALFHALGALEELMESEKKSKEKRIESLDELFGEEVAYAQNSG